MGDVLNQRVQLYRDNSNTVTNNSIELPAEIDELIDNKMFRNKFRKLMREGHTQDLLELAKIAETKDQPSHWFAKITAKARWEGTLQWLARARETARRAAEIVKRINIPETGMKVVYKACWKLNDVAIRHAITAAETGRDQFKLFTWLCFKS